LTKKEKADYPKQPLVKGPLEKKDPRSPGSGKMGKKEGGAGRKVPGLKRGHFQGSSSLSGPGN